MVVCHKEQEKTGECDAVMVAAAKKLGCHEIVTEDLNDGRLYCGMAIVNPFK